MTDIAIMRMKHGLVRDTAATCSGSPVWPTKKVSAKLYTTVTREEITDGIAGWADKFNGLPSIFVLPYSRCRQDKKAPRSSDLDASAYHISNGLSFYPYENWLLYSAAYLPSLFISVS